MEFFQAIANMSGDSLAQHLANGISLGSLYALIAIGYTMVYGILLMINFAHGDIVMMACYFAFFGITVFHIPWYITFVGVIIATAILGVVIGTDGLIVRCVTHRKILFLFLLSALHFYWKTWLITYSAAVRCVFLILNFYRRIFLSAGFRSRRSVWSFPLLQ